MTSPIDRWPDAFSELKNRLTDSTSTSLVVAESFTTSESGESRSRTLTTGLIDEEHYLAIPPEEELGHEVRASGPYPTPRNDSIYTPSFDIFAGSGTAEIEPLVPAWKSTDRTVFQPDAGFLMTYGLVPRVMPTVQEISWDEPSVPIPDVVRARPVSLYESQSASRAFVTIRREHIQDYASLRGKCAVTLFWESWTSPTNSEAQAALHGDRSKEVVLPYAIIRYSRIDHDPPSFRTEIWGRWTVIKPGPLPVSIDREEAGTLVWPGFPEPVTSENWRGLGTNFTFVSDDVLADFEGRDEYAIIPELGAVSYGNQWGLDYCQRFGRDLIRLELKKLYEGCPLWVVRKFHQHAVSPPVGDQRAQSKSPNIAVRAKSIVFATVRLGDAIARIGSSILGRSLRSMDVVKLDRDELEYRGWWKAANAESLAFHIPRAAKRDHFLTRCKHLTHVLVEPVSDSLLREILDALGVKKPNTEELRSIKLLELLLELVARARRDGMTLTELSKRPPLVQLPKPDPSPVACLLAVNNLRQLDAHARGENARKFDVGLATFSIDPASVAHSFSFAIDRVYDALAGELEACAQTLESAEL